MTVYDEMKKDLESYLADEVGITIVDVEEVTTSGGVSYNPNDVYRFKIRVRNDGHLDMKDTELEITGLNDIEVSFVPDGDWEEAITTDAMNVAGKVRKKTAYLYFKIPADATPGPTEFFEVKIDSWNAKIGSMLNRHSNGGATPYDVQSGDILLL